MKYLWLPISIAFFLFGLELRLDLVGVSFLFLVLQSAIFLRLSIRHSINLKAIYFLFSLVFLSLIPWLHYSRDIIIWRSTGLSESTVLQLNMVLIIANFLTIAAYRFGRKISVFNVNNPIIVKNTRFSVFLLLLFAATGFFTLFYINNFSLANIFFRGLLFSEASVNVIESSSLSLFTTMTARLVPAFCFFWATTQLNNQRIPLVLLFLILLLSAFPTGIPRYMIGFIYIPLILLYIPKLRSANLFAGLFILSIIFVFPFFNQFRRFDSFANLSLLPSPSFFFEAHFDAYENMASVLESGFVTYGFQLLGSILFFIPRVIWTDKPVGSGYVLANNLGYVFNNISMPFLGEGFINFGLLGLFMFAITIGYLMARLDSHFVKLQLTERTPYSLVIYYFMIGALFFLLRGDLLSSVAYITAGVVVYIFIGKVMNFINRISVNKDKISRNLK